MEIEVRAVRPDELACVHEVHRLAFDGRAGEADVVAALHAAGAAPVSLLAVLDGRRIVGHVLFSEVELDPARPDLHLVGLAPVGVLPECQNRGVGSRLIHEGLKACRQAGYDAVVVLGDPAYYSRFGFTKASEYGIGNEYGFDDPFMAVELESGALSGANGSAKYRPEFRKLEV